jgi:hypothetical protein
LAGVILVCLVLAWGHRAEAASDISLRKDGSVEMAGRALRCGTVRSALDLRLRNLGISIPKDHLLVINPVLLRAYSDTVRLFVFYHECGHHHVGASELGADCWAVGQGVREGWLDAAGLRQVCASFGNMPETSTHPSAARRCRNLDQCFGASTESVKASLPSEPRTAAEPTRPDLPRPVVGPTLIRSGVAP